VLGQHRPGRRPFGRVRHRRQSTRASLR
jgi:hypothetical protein